MQRMYLCIDLKSFYASVECVDRGLDPFTTDLVVADPSRGRGAICLAVTPAMKQKGVRNRCRLFEIPQNLDYITAVPRMRRYMEVSAAIVKLYLRFVSPDDIHVYSVDECFIDATPYLTLYHQSPRQFAQTLMDAVNRETGICATAGIGTNLFLAKVALDLTAKHAKDHIGMLDEARFRETIWHHRPITDIWGIGRGTAKRLEQFGVFDLYGVTQLPEACLYKTFGVNAQYLLDHANGKESGTIAQIHAYRPKTTSLSNSQILFSDYEKEGVRVVLREMVDAMVLKLVEQGLAANGVSLTIGYSKDIHRATGGSHRLERPTDSFEQLMAAFETIFDNTTKDLPIRRLGIALTDLVSSAQLQLSLFDNLGARQKEQNLQRARVEIKNKFGKNALLRGISYTAPGTARSRNKLIGGHNGE